MKLKDDYALTTHEDENGAEWDVKVFFNYQPFEGPDYEDGHMVYPGCEAHVSVEAVNRNEPIYDVANWCEFTGATDKEEAAWSVEIHELINQQGEDDRG